MLFKLLKIIIALIVFGVAVFFAASLWEEHLIWGLVVSFVGGWLSVKILFWEP